MSSIHQFRKIVTSQCEECGVTIEGLKTKKFCGYLCKVRNFRKKKKATIVTMENEKEVQKII
jgi:anaerobic ribonucleoside-triphosphate reductase